MIMRSRNTLLKISATAATLIALGTGRVPAATQSDAILAQGNM